MLNAGISSSIWRCSRAGGQLERVTVLQAGELEHRSPTILPGGHAILYTALRGGSTGQLDIYAEDLQSHDRQRVTSGAMARYLPSGQLFVVGWGGS